ncbi:MAG TPA: sarcosine oxidase subunit beta family protein [Phenylobacterium sp.]|jgi:sarcosine oxidase subunit beta|uniref:sarcosine oxidase subunit beta family protein n=1 Tax=Phenylobacterium sp. TaxID=1871053 RepID=UPI002D376A01|nr:sarcosine oxidase subunit beta family protein [Phenylobacterium sp.]HZZ70294.1 sarcosine oxidase subunit beta family protein [Phenylobacterium sp.]
MDRYSAFRLFREGLRDQAGWTPAWRKAPLKKRYKVAVIGGGGHGLATAYYLAKNHGISDVAVIERGWLGGGNTGRNTTVIRSNYYYPASVRLYDFALKLYEGLSRELNYNVMFSPRGMITLIHSRHEMDSAARWVGAMQLNGADARMIGREEVARRIPALDVSPGARFPVVGGFIQERAGTARHDAVAWGYARGASALGVDIVENCEVQGFLGEPGRRIEGVATSLGEVRADKVVMCVAGHSSVLAAMAGFDLPITSYALQAFVSEPVKPVLDVIALSTATGMYISQSDKGGLVMGGGLDLFPSYAQRGSTPTMRRVLGAVAEQFPAFGDVKLLRQWAGVVDVVPDSSPILGASPVAGLYLNCGWGTGGFKAIPAGGWLTAHHVATGEIHDIARPFTLDRFAAGALLDEAAASGIAH